MKNKCRETSAPDRIGSWFRAEGEPLVIVTVTGILYNIGMTAGPLFEGLLAQKLCDTITGTATAREMLMLASSYVAVLALVQILRTAKRFYVRRFANDVNRGMKRVLYRNLVHRPTAEMEQESTGQTMTKAVADVDACAEGMRKFTTEVFDTGVVMVAYCVLLFRYDWRLALICCAFPPIAYIIAEQLKKTVSRCASAYKESAGRLNAATLDRIDGAVTYRVLGAEKTIGNRYETQLGDYENKAVRAGVLETTLQPLYLIVSSVSVIFLLWFGSKNVLGTGWAHWNIAAFTTFLSCFTKLAAKSSKAAKLFNAVQKARVSWRRIRPWMKSVPEDAVLPAASPSPLTVRNLSFSYPDGNEILHQVSFSVQPGQIIAVTGPVACGKSTLGKIFLCETPYCGSVCIGDRELRELSDAERCATVTYLGHDPQLLSASVADNIALGDPVDLPGLLRLVRLKDEISAMPDGVETRIGTGGARLSGGQQARVALARTLAHIRPLMILDDPFSALDRTTEREVLTGLRGAAQDGILMILSHRLTVFPDADKVLWISNGTVTESTHTQLMKSNPEYRALYETQTGGTTR